MASVNQPLYSQTPGIALPTGTDWFDNPFRIPSLDPNAYYVNKGAIFYKLLMMLGSPESEEDLRFQILHDERFATSTTADAGYDDSVTTIGVDDAGVVVPRTVFRNMATGENILVTAAAAINNLTVTRGYQGTTAAAITAGDTFRLMGTVLPEGGTAGQGVADVPTWDYNYISLFSERMSQTDVQALVNMLNQTGQIPQQMNKYISRLTDQMDTAIRYSKRSEDLATFSGQPIYTTGGFDTMVTTNDIDLSGTLTYDTFNSNFCPIYDQTESSEMKILLADPTLFSQISAIPWTNYTGGSAVPQFDKVLGNFITDIQLECGSRMKIMRDPYGFEGKAGSGFLIDPAYIGLKQFKNWDIITRDISQVDSHTEELELYGSVGLNIKREEHHALVNWTA